MSKFLNISTDNNLGGNNANDNQVSSQKAVKEYIDNQDLSDANLSISNLADGDTIQYNSASSKWVNTTQNSAIIRDWTNS